MKIQNKKMGFDKIRNAPVEVRLIFADISNSYYRAIPDLKDRHPDPIEVKVVRKESGLGDRKIVAWELRDNPARLEAGKDGVPAIKLALIYDVANKRWLRSDESPGSDQSLTIISFAEARWVAQLAFPQNVLHSAPEQVVEVYEAALQSYKVAYKERSKVRILPHGKTEDAFPMPLADRVLVLVEGEADDPERFWTICDDFEQAPLVLRYYPARDFWVSRRLHSDVTSNIRLEEAIANASLMFSDRPGKGT